MLIPNPEAPVVWGRLELLVRGDFALLEMRYYDQRGDVVRIAQFSGFLEVGGYPLPTVAVVEEPGGDRVVERMVDPEFDVEIPDEVFTLEFLEAR